MNQPTLTATVMIVDDTPANLALLEGILRGVGHRVVSFPSGSLALRAAAATPPDLMLVDVLMPGMDGFALCRSIKADKALADIPVLFLSALGDTDTKLRAFAEGGADYITKPFQEAEVLARVATHLRLHRQQRELLLRNRELAESYERLKEAEALRDQLVHMLVHDLRSPIGGILLGAQLIDLESQACHSGACGKAARQILRTGSALNGMINDLLDISRLESNSMPVDASQHSMLPLIRTALAKLGITPADAERILGENAPGVEAYCDAKLTSRMVENLVGNALKFAGVAGLSISCTARGERVEMRVKDQGPGIAKEFHSRIFQKFEQAECLTKCGRMGTGLGLFFCKLAAEAQQGEIGLESEPGRGSEFWFTLPRQPQ